MEPAVTKQPRLMPHLVPKPLWGKNAHQLFGRRALWKQMRSDALEAARHTCEVCSNAPSPIHGDPLTCHEVWHYDDKRGVATLTRLKIHCGKCDSAVHMGMAAAYGGLDTAVAQLCKVNEIGPEEAKQLFAAEMILWRKRSKKKWRVAVAKPLLKRYPQLADLENEITARRTHSYSALRTSSLSLMPNAHAKA